jgi:1,2-diacylglycerol 3-beta-galactosyltransferase
MANPPSKKPNILFLFSDTGGGHRSAAEAIIEALQLEYDDRISTQMVDIFKDIAPRPLNSAPKLYPYLVRFPDLWGASYRLTNGSRRAKLIVDGAYPYVRRALKKVIEQYPADLYVSVHPLANNPFLHALGEEHPPYIAVVTDLATTHTLWYHKSADLTLVPTEIARQRGLLKGLRPDLVKVVVCRWLTGSVGLWGIKKACASSWVGHKTNRLCCSLAVGKVWDRWKKPPPPSLMQICPSRW